MKAGRVEADPFLRGCGAKNGALATQEAGAYSRTNTWPSPDGWADARKLRHLG